MVNSRDNPIDLFWSKVPEERDGLDLNSVRDGRAFIVEDPVNGPTTGSFYVFVYTTNTNGKKYVLQKAYKLLTGEVYYCTATSGTWSSWVSGLATLDPDLEAIAALTTTTFGRNLLTLSAASALRTAISIPTSTTTGRLARYTDTAGTQGQTTGLYEDAAGKVGINNTSPNSIFEVGGNAAFGASALLFGTSGAEDVGFTRSTTNIMNVTRGLSGVASGYGSLNVDSLYTRNSSGLQKVRLTLYGLDFCDANGISWTNGSQSSNTADVTLSRGASGKLYVGTTAMGTSNGTLVAGKLGAGRTSPVCEVDSAGPVRAAGYTVATLPAASLGDGMMAFVTDANTTLAAGIGTTVVGGGSNYVPVYSRSSAWIIG